MNDNDFHIKLQYNVPIHRLYRAIATQAGICGWWTIFCEMDEQVGGKASFRFPSSDFYAVVNILKLQPDQLIEWECTDSKHPANSGFSNLHDWIGTRMRFELSAIDEKSSILTFSHVGLLPLECAGTCSNLWSFYLGQSLRGYLERGAGQPHVKDISASAST